MSDTDGDIRTPFLTGLAATLIVAVVFRMTDLDVDLQAIAFSASEPHWPYGTRQPWRLLHEVGTLPGLLLTAGAIVAAAASFIDARFVHWRFPAVYIVILTAAGPGIVTNLLGKVLAGRPRPDEVIPFGGTMPFLQPFDLGTPGKGFSFLCGHCSMAFLFFAFFFLRRDRKRWIAFAFAAIFGVLLGAARIAQAAHFPSDVLLGGTIMFTVAAALAPLARIRPAPVVSRSRGLIVIAASTLTAILAGLFLLSMPIHSEHTHTWIDGAPRRAATNETLRRWDAPEFVSIHVEAGDVTIRSADQPDPLVIRSRVTGYGFPGADGKTAVTRQGRSLIFTHRRERGQWEVHPTFDVLVRRGIEVKFVATTREGRIRR